MIKEHEALDWDVEGTEEFTVRMRNRIPDGVIIDSVDEVKLQRLVSAHPEVWEDTGVVASTTSIIADNFDADNPVASNAVYFTALADNDGDPVKGLVYRWLVLVTLNNGLNRTAKVPVNLIP